MQTVVKRDGRKVELNKDLIKNAIMKACIAAGEDQRSVENELDSIVNNVLKDLNEETHVETIQDKVEEELSVRYPKVARAYIKYRYERQLARDNYTELMNAVEEKLKAKNIKKQNANVDESSAGGRQGEASDVIQKHFALSFMLSDKSKDNHENNRIYIHDLNAYSVGIHNCLTMPLDMLLEKGFNTRQVDIRPAQSVSTAMQLIAVLFQIQSLQQFGGVAASHLDHTMVPYVRKSFYKYFKEILEITEEKCDVEDIADYLSITSSVYVSCPKTYKFAMKRLDKEIYQAVEALYHNLNSLQSRSGNQLPFSSINYGTCTLPEGRKIIKAILGISIKGLGKLHKTSVFPCGIFQMMKGVNRKPGDPNYDLFRLALRSTSQRLYPNYANCDWSNNAGYDKNDPRTYFATMGKQMLQLM